MAGGGGLQKKYGWGGHEKNKMCGGGASAEKIKCMGGCPRKNKNVWWGVRDFFQSVPPVRISNGIALRPWLRHWPN